MRKIITKIIINKNYIYFLLFISVLLSFLLLFNNTNTKFNITFTAKNDNSVSIKLLNNDTTPLYYYDSLLADENDLPTFLWVKFCHEPFESKCNDEEWLSPHFHSSTLINLPVKLKKLKVWNYIEKEIKYIDIINQLDFNTKNKKLIKFKINIFEDSNLNKYKSFDSDWIKFVTP